MSHDSTHDRPFRRQVFQAIHCAGSDKRVRGGMEEGKVGRTEGRKGMDMAGAGQLGTERDG